MPDSVQSAQDLTSWPIMVAVIVLISACVVIHMEALRLIARRIVRPIRSIRLMMIATLLALIVTHIVEIAIFGAGYQVLHALFDTRIGTLDGDYNGSFDDSGYFSGIVYTTVGFGDITPTGPLRLLVACEALTGLVLVTWSASFTFLVMQRRWGQLSGSDDSASEPPHGS